MRERNIHRIIEEQDAEDNRALYEKLQVKLNIADLPTKTNNKRLKKSWIVSLVATCILIVCLTITLPIVLKDNGNHIRFCHEADSQGKGLIAH